MTEKEKAELGMLYDASHDEELNNEYLNASLLLVDYNRSLPIEQGMRRGILKELLGKVGEGCEIRPPFYCDRGTILKWAIMFLRIIISRCLIVRK